MVMPSSSATRTRSPGTDAGDRADGVDATDAADIAGRLRLSATRLARQLRQESGSGLTPSQLSALAQIARHGPLTLGALAERERVAPPSITRVVSKLDADGLVTREPSPDDRRVVHVAVTGAGAALLDATRRRKDAWLTARLAELDEFDRARLVAALDVLDAITTEAEA